MAQAPSLPMSTCGSPSQEIADLDFCLLTVGQTLCIATAMCSAEAARCAMASCLVSTLADNQLVFSPASEGQPCGLYVAPSTGSFATFAEFKAEAPPAKAVNLATLTPLFNINGDGQTALGEDAGSDAGAVNETALGWSAAKSNTGDNSTFVGYIAGKQNSEPDVTGIGSGAAALNSGSNLTAIGSDAGLSNTADFVTLVGRASGQLNTGFGLTAIGHLSGRLNTGSQVTAIGRQSGESNTGGSLVAVGQSSGQANTGAFCTLIGFIAGRSNHGQSVTAVGTSAAERNEGTYVTAIGVSAGVNNQASKSSFLGMLSGSNNLGDSSTLIGFMTGNCNQAIASVAVGSYAGSSNLGPNMVSIGNRSGVYNKGNGNTYVGAGADASTLFSPDVSAMFSANSNVVTVDTTGFGPAGDTIQVVLSCAAVPNNPDPYEDQDVIIIQIIDDFSATILGPTPNQAGTGTTLKANVAIQLDNVSVIGAGATATQSNQVVLGNGATTLVSSSGDAIFNGISVPSDGRYKNILRELPRDMYAVIGLQPVIYKLVPGSPISKNLGGLDRERMGLIAQNVEASYPQAVKEVNGLKVLDYSCLVAPLIAAVNAMVIEIEILKQKLGA